MVKVEFKIDLLKDAENYYDCANSSNGFGYDFSKCLKPKILKKIKNKKWEDVSGYIVGLLGGGYSEHKKDIEKRVRENEKQWNVIGGKYFDRLAKITKHKIYTDKFNCYMTTISRCPYDKDENWYMVNVFSDLKMNLMVGAHELMHLQFHHYFEKDLIKKGKLSPNQFQDLKESLTVLLNLEFSDLIEKEDVGYPNHQKLRKFISQEWGKQPDFDILIKSCVKYLKG